jgi:hypothetical protein
VTDYPAVGTRGTGDCGQCCPSGQELGSLRTRVGAGRNLDTDLQHRRRAAWAHLHFDFVRLDRDVPTNNGKDFLSKDVNEIRSAGGRSFVRQQDL